MVSPLFEGSITEAQCPCVYISAVGREILASRDSSTPLVKWSIIEIFVLHLMYLYGKMRGKWSRKRMVLPLTETPII
jgi:hypothetical protein